MGLVEIETSPNALVFKQRQRAPIFDDQYKNMLGAGQIATMSLSRDPNAKASYIAQELGLPANRIDFFDDLPVYIDDEGKQFSLAPEWSFSPSDILKRSAFLAGDIPVMTGAIGGAAVPAPVNPLLKSAAGTAAGEAVRQGMAGALVGEELSLEDRAKYQGIEQALNLGGEVVGDLTSRLLGRHVPVNMFARELSDRRLAEYNELLDKARRHGIDFISPAEGTRLKTFAALEQVLQRQPVSAETIENVLEIRNDQSADAVMKFIRLLSPDTGSLIEAGAKARDAASKAMEAQLKIIQDEASPIYQEAFGMGTQVDVTKTLAKIASLRRVSPEGGSLRPQLEALKKQLERTPTTLPSGQKVRARNLRTVHHVKLEMDRILTALNVSGESLSQAQKVHIQEIKTSLLNDIRKNSIGDRGKEAGELYESARSIYEEGMPAVTQLEASLVNVIADKSEISLHKIADTIFNPSMIDPKSMEQVKKAILTHDPQAWTALIGTYLQQQFARQTEAATGNILEGAKFRKAVFGSRAKREMWKEALEPEQYKVMSELMDVLAATGKVFASNQSITAFATEVQETTLKDGGGLSKVFLIAAPHVWGTRTKDWLDQLGTEKITRRLAEIITDPDAIEELKKFKLLGSKDTRRIINFLKLLGVPHVRDYANPLIAPERGAHERDDIPPMMPTTDQNRRWPEGATDIETPKVLDMFGR
tara:strand:- start:2452 stop:4566 length:2115 start_codon:yes stop_codon:yes gene_type:complete